MLPTDSTSEPFEEFVASETGLADACCPFVRGEPNSDLSAFSVLLLGAVGTAVSSMLDDSLGPLATASAVTPDPGVASCASADRAPAPPNTSVNPSTADTSPTDSLGIIRHDVRQTPSPGAEASLFPTASCNILDTCACRDIASSLQRNEVLPHVLDATGLNEER